MMDIRKLTLEEVNRTMSHLENTRLAPVYWLRHFITLIGGDLRKIPYPETGFGELENRMEAFV